MNDVLDELYEVATARRENPQEGSYTCYLFEKGIDKILKKVGEECTEMVIAAKNNDKEETVYEGIAFERQPKRARLHLDGAE